MGVLPLPLLRMPTLFLLGQQEDLNLGQAEVLTFSQTPLKLLPGFIRPGFFPLGSCFPNEATRSLHTGAGKHRSLQGSEEVLVLSLLHFYPRPQDFPGP